MVGAGIFALLGAAGEVAGAAVWVSFLLAGVIAALQGYSFAKLGARYPSAGGLLEYVAKGFGDGHLTGITAWLTYAANAIVTAMVAVSFGSYASAIVRRRERGLGQVLRRADHRRHDRGEHRRVEARRERPDRDRVRGGRDPRRLRGGHPRQHGPVAAGAVGLPAAARHRLQRRADLLRLPRLRHHHLHGEGPGEAVAPAAQGDVPRALDRHRHLHRHRAGRLRHADRRRGDLLGRHRAGRRRGAVARPGRLLPDGGHGAVRHRGRHQRRAVPGGRAVRATGGDGRSSPH